MSSTEPRATGKRLCGDPVDILTRRHHLAHRPVGQTHDARDDRAFAFLDHPRLRRFGDDQVQFLGGDPVLRFAVEAEQAKDERGTIVEQPDKRRGDARQPIHHRRDDNRDPLGRAQRELFRHKLARDQRGIGGERDDRGEARCLGGFGIETKPGRKPVSDRISASQHADQRDADLHSRQEAPGVGGEQARNLGATAPALLGRLQPRVARRNNGEFGHGENAVEQDEDQDDHNIRPGKRGHWAVVRRIGARPLSVSVMSTL